MGNRDLRIQSYMRIRRTKSMNNSLTGVLQVICSRRTLTTLMRSIGTMNVNRESSSAAHKVLPTSRRQSFSGFLCRQDDGNTLRFLENVDVI